MSENEDRPKQDQSSQESKTPPEVKPLLTVTAPECDRVKARVELDPIKLGQPKGTSPISQDGCASIPEKPNQNLRAPEFIGKLASDMPPAPPKKQNKDTDPK